MTKHDDDFGPSFSSADTFELFEEDDAQEKQEAGYIPPADGNLDEAYEQDDFGREESLLDRLETRRPAIYLGVATLLLVALLFLLTGNDDPEPVTVPLFTGPGSESGSESGSDALDVAQPVPGEAEDVAPVRPERTGQVAAASAQRESAPAQPERSEPPAAQSAQSAPAETPVASAQTSAPASASPSTPAAEPRVPPAAQSSSSFSSAEQALLALPPGQFTVQLLGSSSETNIREFVTRANNGSSGAAAFSYFETRRESGPWFVVVHGAYADREAAERASRNLPAELAAGEPWIRGLEAIQAEIRDKN